MTAMLWVVGRTMKGGGYLLAAGWEQTRPQPIVRASLELGKTVCVCGGGVSVRGQTVGSFNSAAHTACRNPSALLS